METDGLRGEGFGSEMPSGVKGVSGSAKSQAPSCRRRAIRIFDPASRLLNGVIRDAGCRGSSIIDFLIDVFTFFSCLLSLSCSDFERRMRTVKYVITATSITPTNATVTATATTRPCCGVGKLVAVGALGFSEGDDGELS